MVRRRMGEVQVTDEATQEERLLDILLAKVRIRRLRIETWVRHMNVPCVKINWNTTLRTWTILNSFVTTVATPFKKLGLLRPSI